MRVPEHPPCRQLPSPGQRPRPPHILPCLLQAGARQSSLPPPHLLPAGLTFPSRARTRPWRRPPPRAVPSPARRSHGPRPPLPAPHSSPSSPADPRCRRRCPRLMLRRGPTPPCPPRASAATGSACGRGLLRAGAFACPHPALRGHGRRGDSGKVGVVINAEGQNALDVIKVLSRSSKSGMEPVIFWKCVPRGKMPAVVSLKLH